MQAGKQTGEQVFSNPRIPFIVMAWIEWFDDFP
jgi:hypothetical protein